MNEKQRFAFTLNVTSASFAPAANAIAGVNLSSARRHSQRDAATDSSNSPMGKRVKPKRRWADRKGGIMIMRRTILVATVAALLGVGLFGRAEDATAQEPPREIAAALTDPAIDFALAGGEHIVWPVPARERRINKLFVVLPGAGNNLPRDWELVGAEAARLGYHTIALAYRNDAPLAQRCPGELASQSPADCAINLRREIIDGVDRPPLGTVVATPANGIDNRLTKLLQYLDANFPGEEWVRFLDGDDPKWSEITISGHSLGAGEAVLIGLLRRVHRVVAFAGWADARHGWVKLASPAPTPAERFFALIHQRDTFFPRTCYAYKPPEAPDPLQPSLAPFGLGLVAACPWPGFGNPTDTANPLLAENATPPYGGAHVLVTNLTPRNPTNIADPFHPSPSRDQFTPLAADGTPLLVNAWRYLLGTDHDGDDVHYDADNCAAAANADQTDTDGDDLGDACDPDDDNDQAADASDNCGPRPESRPDRYRRRRPGRRLRPDPGQHTGQGHRRRVDRRSEEQLRLHRAVQHRNAGAERQRHLPGQGRGTRARVSRADQRDRLRDPRGHPRNGSREQPDQGVPTRDRRSRRAGHQRHIRDLVARLRSRRSPQRRQHPDPLSERETSKARVTDPARAFLTPSALSGDIDIRVQRHANQRQRGGAVAPRTLDQHLTQLAIQRTDSTQLPPVNAMHRDHQHAPPARTDAPAWRTSATIPSRIAARSEPPPTPSSPLAPHATQAVDRRSLLHSEEKQASHSVAARLSLRTSKRSVTRPDLLRPVHRHDVGRARAPDRASSLSQ
jgi:hypothetical protein